MKQDILNMNQKKAKAIRRNAKKIADKIDWGYTWDDYNMVVAKGEAEVREKKAVKMIKGLAKKA